jgi:hypothetical protein
MVRLFNVPSLDHQHHPLFGFTPSAPQMVSATDPQSLQDVEAGDMADDEQGEKTRNSYSGDLPRLHQVSRRL